jgi:DNA repair protein RecN (Recombination protein N)
MLKELRLTNIILVESATIPFTEGFNVLSGETGSGKSAIMNALNLLIGERADTGVIRRGCDKGIVEAIFDIQSHGRLLKMLEAAGIDHEGDELFIRREVLATGKSRAFINHQMAQLSLLKMIGEQLMEVAGQHANQKLMNLEKHREILDTFGNLQEEASSFAKSWEKENVIRQELDNLINSEAQRLREIEVCRMELEELEEARLKEGEDEELFAEYSLLSNSEERAAKAQEINQGLSGDRQPILAHLNKLKAAFEQLSRIDPVIEDQSKAFGNVLLELQEISYTMRNYATRVEYNPDRLESINDRLTLITRLKRKYGSSLDEINQYQRGAKEKLARLEGTDSEIEDLRNRLAEIESKNHELAQQLSKHRLKAAKKLEKELVSQLRSLNMPKVEFIAEVTSQKRNRHGDDRIEFYLVPNVGESQIPIRECASGGELSRLMLALQALLAGKEQIPTLIFDEIDANIGGETASIVGQKLKEIGERHQVLCITHFHQVARLANHHLQISKIEKGGRTVTQVKMLEEESKEAELERMLGGSA